MVDRIHSRSLKGRGSRPAMLEIDTRKLDPSKLQSFGDYSVYTEDIPPEVSMLFL